MINYIDTPGLAAALFRAGFVIIETANGYHAAQGGRESEAIDAAAQAIIDGYNPLPDAKTAKIAVIKADGLARMQVGFPAIATLDDVTLLAEFWMSIAPAARAPTVPFKRIIDIYSAAKAAIALVNAAATVPLVNAVSPSWPA